MSSIKTLNIIVQHTRCILIIIKTKTKTKHDGNYNLDKLVNLLVYEV